MATNAKKVKKTIEIPMSLAKLLIAEADDLKRPEDFQNVQDVAKASLRVLVALAEEE